MANLMTNQLVPTEDVIMSVRPMHIYALVFLLPKLFLAVIIGWAAFYFNVHLILLLSAFFFLLGVYKYLLIKSKTYYLTEQQLIVSKGVFTTTVNYLELYRVKDILVRQNLLMKLFGLMNVSLLSFDTSAPILILQGINVSNIPQKIRNKVQECRHLNQVLSIDN